MPFGDKPHAHGYTELIWVGMRHVLWRRPSRCCVTK